MVNGSRGRLELEVAENRFVDRATATTVKGMTVQGAALHGETPPAARLLLRPFWSAPVELELPPARGGHDAADAAKLFERGLRGAAGPDDAEAFRAHMLVEFARMSVEDGLVMQLHPGAVRDHNPWLHASFGRDAGGDIPSATDYVHGLKPLLDRFGNDPRLRLVLFTLDETTYTRELAPLAGGYPAVYLGAPWWFLDSPEGMRRFREAVTETAGFYNTVGFTDDTRAFCSIAVRHDAARRVDASFLARLVAEGRLPLDEAAETIVDLAYRLPRRVYRLGVPAGEGA